MLDIVVPSLPETRTGPLLGPILETQPNPFAKLDSWCRHSAHLSKDWFGTNHCGISLI